MDQLYIYTIKLLTLIIGFAGIAIAFLYYFQFKKPTALYFGAFLSGLFLIHFGEWSNFMSKIYPGFYELPGYSFFIFFTSPCYFLISYFGIKFTLSLFGKRLNRIVDIIIITYHIFQIVSDRFGFLYSKHPYDMIPIILASLFMALYTLFNFRNIADKFLKKSILSFILISSLFLPFLLLFFVEDYYSLINILTYIYFLTISVASIIFGYYFFARKPYMEGGKPTQNFADKFSITQREMEVIELILMGKTTKDIGDELCIAARTVTTHITNIYSKVNIKSRVQLINLFGSNWSN